MLLATPEWAAQRNLPVLAYLRYGKVWAVDFASGKEGLLMAPAYAVAAMLRDAGLTLQDFDYYEIHEAFAAQVLCTLKAWESRGLLPRSRSGCPPRSAASTARKLNVKGGSVALGHPVRGHRHAHRRVARQDSRRRPTCEARTRLGLHRRGHGSNRDHRTLIRVRVLTTRGQP